ncbi:MAG: phosphotransferase [Alphaproteobacteria bacterium]|nr:phosphotransferase [Alphaproteobacteria bacterium]MDG1888572.1 phosphotransferase [Alphaproteobacteria bacterium]|tara:strand:+ start:593 stop:1621 length:1029 start_codon:yes stop_codon:yes gene_type:complete
MEVQESEQRLSLLQKFLWENELGGFRTTPLADDCSFRRYFRATLNDASFVVMDAPPEKENTKPFIKVSELLNGYGYSAPKIIKVDPVNGFLILEDFGDETYTKALSQNKGEMDLYRLAIDLLIDLGRRNYSEEINFLPVYDRPKLLEEVLLFIDWYLIPRLKVPISDLKRKEFLSIWDACLDDLVEGSQNVLVLRDYHVDNLIHLSDRNGLRACGLLDFQDAVQGPASYDLVSLLQDSRRDINPSLRTKMLDRYFNGMAGKLDPENFMTSFYALGTQRALKVFGIFTRQSLKYGNHQYLVHIPRLWHHTLKNLSMPQLRPIKDWLLNNVSEDAINAEIASNT